MVAIPPIYGVDWGMVHHCFTNIDINHVFLGHRSYQHLKDVFFLKKLPSVVDVSMITEQTQN